jgi:hypothetical protein
MSLAGHGKRAVKAGAGPVGKKTWPLSLTAAAMAELF